MLFRTSIVALVAAAAIAVPVMAPTSASAFGGRLFVRAAHHVAYARGVAAGVFPCKRGIVYVCQ